MERVIFWQRPYAATSPVSNSFASGVFSEVPSVSNRWPENQSETPSASCMKKSWPAQTDLIIVWSHCGVGGCSEGRGQTYHPPRLHAQGPRELLDRCEDRKSVKRRSRHGKGHHPGFDVVGRL